MGAFWGFFLEFFGLSLPQGVEMVGDSPVLLYHPLSPSVTEACSPERQLA